MGYIILIAIIIWLIQLISAHWIPILSVLGAVLSLIGLVMLIGHLIARSHRVASGKAAKSKTAPTPPTPLASSSTQSKPSHARPASKPSQSHKTAEPDLTVLNPEDRKNLVKVIGYVKATRPTNNAPAASTPPPPDIEEEPFTLYDWVQQQHANAPKKK